MKKLNTQSIFLLLTMIGFAQTNDYIFQYDASGNRTELQSTVGCNLFCECPEDASDWLSIREVENNHFSCYKYLELSIPDKYNCFEQYKLSRYKSNNLVEATDSWFLPDEEIEDYALWAGSTDPAEEVTYVVDLYRFVGDSNPCSLTFTDVCTPSCDQLLYVDFEETGTSGNDCCYKFILKSHAPSICDPADWVNQVEIFDGNGNLLDLDTEYCFDITQNHDFTYLIWWPIPEPEPVIMIEKDLRIKPNCELDCCNLFSVVFEDRGEQNGSCCWEPKLLSQNSTHCSTSDFEVEIFDKNGQQLSLNQDGVLCLPKNMKNYITYSVKNTQTNESCSPQSKMLSCGICVDCPSSETMRNWIKLDVEKEGSGCGPNQCSVTASLDIPEKYMECFSGLDVSYYITDKDGSNLGAVDFSGVFTPHSPSNPLSGLPPCIESGEKINVAIRLSKAGSNEVCELASGEEYCEPYKDINRPEPCTPDSPEDEWSEEREIEVTVLGCKYYVTYVYRKTGLGYQDIQFLNIQSTNSGCNGLNSRQQILRSALSKAIRDILSYDDNFYPKKSDGNPCVDTWRVVQRECWASWVLDQGDDGHEFSIDVPCESVCCMRRIRVCYIDDQLWVKDLGPFGTTIVDCSSQTRDITFTFMGNTYILAQDLICSGLSCDVFDEMDEAVGAYDPMDDFIDNIDEFVGHTDSNIGISRKRTFINTKKNETDSQSILLTVLKDQLLFKFKEGQESIVKIKLYDLLGNQITNSSVNSVIQGEKISLKLPTYLQSGSYFIIIESENEILFNDKFLITK